MGSDGPTMGRDAAELREQARALRRAGRLAAAIDLLAEAADGDLQRDVGVRLDLAQALLAAGRIEEAEAVRVPGGGR